MDTRAEMEGVIVAGVAGRCLQEWSVNKLSLYLAAGICPHSVAPLRNARRPAARS
jgi:hypothetical protein